MPLSRRGFLGGLLAAPAVIRTPGLLMPIRAPLLLPDNDFYPGDDLIDAYSMYSESDGYGLINSNGSSWEGKSAEQMLAEINAVLATFWDKYPLRGIGR